MLISRGDITVFIDRPISAVFVGLSTILILAQVYFWLRRKKLKPAGTPEIAKTPAEAEA
jgi:TctA family transporter